MPRKSATERKPDGRRQRADGARSRQAILNAATELATVEGLDGLSIGRLAEHVGMSKSGLFAHFRSKEDLQVATIDAAAEMFDREVWQPGRAAPAGVALAHRNRCRVFISENVASSQRTAVPASAIPAARAMTGRTPSRPAIRTSVPIAPAAAAAESRVARKATDPMGIRLKALPSSTYSGVPGRMGHLEAGGHVLHLRPVAEADAAQRGGRVDDECRDRRQSGRPLERREAPREVAQGDAAGTWGDLRLGHVARSLRAASGDRTIGWALTHERSLLDCADRTARPGGCSMLEADLGQFDRQDRRMVAVVITTDGRRVHVPVEPNPLSDVSILALLRSLLGLDGLLGLITGSRREDGGTRRNGR